MGHTSRARCWALSSALSRKYWGQSVAWRLVARRLLPSRWVLGGLPRCLQGSEERAFAGTGSESQVPAAPRDLPRPGAAERRRHLLRTEAPSFPGVSWPGRWEPHGHQPAGRTRVPHRRWPGSPARRWPQSSPEEAHPQRLQVREAWAHERQTGPRCGLEDGKEPVGACASVTDSPPRPSPQQGLSLI